MSTKATKTIDDLGFQSYYQFEENKKYLNEKLTVESRDVAIGMATDSFEPLVVTDYQLLFELNLKGGIWCLIPPPERYNEQKGRLFTFQLAPKLGPYELIELQMSRIQEKQKEEKENREKEKKKKLSWEIEQEVKQIDKEANIL